MTLAAGLGSVVAKNELLRTSIIPNVIGGTNCGNAQASSRDPWSHWFIFDLNKNSSSGWATTYSIPGTYNDIWLKFSPDAYLYAVLAVKPQDGPDHYSIELRRFFQDDPNFWAPPIVVFSGTGLGDLFAGEFSPYGTKFYVSSPGTHRIYQLDHCAGSQGAIANSIYTINTGTVSVYGMRLGPDSKIYCATNPSLSVINNPDLAGAACGFSLHQQSIGTATCGKVLPNICSGGKQYTLSPLSFVFQPTSSTSCGSVSFQPVSLSSYSDCPVSKEGLQLFNWDFGDPASASLNTSTLQSPVHHFTAPGTYSVRLIVTRGSCRKDTLIQTVSIPGPWPSVSVTGNFTVCTGQTATLKATGADSYTWTGNGNGNAYAVSPVATTTYAVKGQNAYIGCISESVFTVHVSSCTMLRSKTITDRQIILTYDHGNLELSTSLQRPVDCSALNIHDMSGRKIIHEKLEWSGDKAVVSLQEIPSGVYLISFENCGQKPLRYLLNQGQN